MHLSAKDRAEIDRWLDAHGTPQQVALRSRIVLAAVWQSVSVSDGHRHQARIVTEALADQGVSTVATRGAACQPGH